MKRFAAGAAVALALALAPAGPAQTASASAPTNDVSIKPYAQYDIQGSILHVEFWAICAGGEGAVVMEVTQSPPETPYPVAFGSGPTPVVCDGEWQEGAVTVYGEGFDAGVALATATLTVVDPTSLNVIATASETRDIDIRVV